jgi:hypothetical protein
MVGEKGESERTELACSQHVNKFERAKTGNKLYKKFKIKIKKN